MTDTLPVVCSPAVVRCLLARATCVAALLGMAWSSWADTPQDYAVTFRLKSASAGVGGVQWSTHYSSATGGFQGSNASVSCTNKVAGALFAPQDTEATRVLTLGVLSLTPFSAPRDLVQCTFNGFTSDPPLPGDFPITIEDATDGDGNPINVSIEVTITGGSPSSTCGNGITESGEQCDDANSVNTDACLNSCLKATCGDGIVRSGVEQCDDGNPSNNDACLATCKLAACGDGFTRTGFEECDDGNLVDGDGCSQLCENQQQCGDATGDGKVFASDALRILQRGVGADVECPTWICDVDGTGGVTAGDALRVLRYSVDIPAVLACGEPTAIVIRIVSAASLGALQFNVGYQGVEGEIDGSGSTVDCQSVQQAVQAAFNDKPERVLSASFVSLSGIVGPGRLARCGFTPSGSVDPGDFVVTILDAKDTSGNPVANPVVKVVPD